MMIRGAASLRTLLRALSVALCMAAAPAFDTASAQSVAVALGLQQGRDALESERYADALTLFEQVLRQAPDDRAAALGRARALDGLGRSEEAVAALDPLIDGQPSDAGPLYHRGLIKLRLGQFDAATRDLQAVLETGVQFPVVYLRLGDALYAQGDADTALLRYRAALELPGAPPESQRLIGNALYALRDYPGAADAYSKALEDDPRDGRAALYRAWTRERLGLLDEALDDYTRAIETLATPDPTAFAARGGAYRRQGDPARALDDFLTALELEPDNPTALFGAASALLDQRRVAATEPYIQALLARAKDSPQIAVAALHQRSRARLIRRDYPGAEEDLDLLLKLAPEDPDALYNRAVARLGRDDAAGALDDLRLLTRLRSDDADAHYLLSRVAISAGLKDEAMTAAANALNGGAATVDSRLSRGLMLMALRRPIEAVAEFDTVLERSPNHVEAMRRKGDALLILGRPDDAIALAERMIDAAPEDPSGHMLQAESLISLDDPPGARVALDRANQLQADPARVARLAGVAWIAEAQLDEDFGLDALEQAQAAFDAAVALSNDDPEALAMRAEARAMLGRLDAAKSDLDAAVGAQPQNADFRFARADVLVAMDRCADAIRDYDAGLSLKPQNSAARAARAGCKFEVGRFLGGVGDYIGSWF